MIICVQLVSCSSHVDADDGCIEAMSIYLVCLLHPGIKPCPEAHTCTPGGVRVPGMYPYVQAHTDTDTHRYRHRYTRRETELEAERIHLCLGSVVQ